MKRIYRLGCLAVVLMAAVLSTGCKGKTDLAPESKEIKSYTLPQIMLIAATEKNRYEEVYTTQVWDIKLGDEGITFDAYLQEQVENFLDELLTMNLLANEKGITPTSAEKEELKSLTKEYMDALTNEDMKYMKLDEDDVYRMYEEYHTANKLVSELTKDMDLEVSDNEAKVITVDVIKLNDKETADAVYQKVIAEGANYESIAKADSVDTIVRRQMVRGENSKDLEEAAFALEEGSVSSVVEADGAYYIVKAVSAYDEAATQERKKNLSAEKKNQAFRQIYDKFLEENPVSINHDVWNRVSFADGNDSTTTNFFDLYREYFPD